MIFEIDKFRLLEVSENKICALVGWVDDEDDEQLEEVQWNPQTVNNKNDINNIIDFLMKNDLISIDKIEVSKDDLCDRLEWPHNQFKTAIENLLKLEIDRMDGEKKQDSFFLHF